MRHLTPGFLIAFGMLCSITIICAPIARAQQIEFGARSVDTMPYKAFGQWVQAVPALKEAVVQSGFSVDLLKDVTINSCPSAQDTAPKNCLEVVGDPAKHSPSHLIFVGLQVGSLLPFALEGVYEFRKNDRLRASADIRIEPSDFLNSYSIAGDFHPFKNGLFLGARIRKFQFKPGSDYSADYYNPWAFGPELGARFGGGGQKVKNRVLGTVSVGMSSIPENWPNDGLSMAPMYNLNIGLAYKVSR